MNWDRITKWFSIALLLVVGVFGILSVKNIRVWSLGDEKAHFAVIQYIAQNYSLPIHYQSQVGWELIAIDHGTYPLPATRTQWEIENQANVYIAEAFQPPLYYLSALPAFALFSDYRHKIFSVRTHNLFLYLICVFILWKLAQEAARDRMESIRFFLFGLLFMALPPVMVRAIAVSNVALEGVFILATFLFLVRAAKTGSLKDEYSASFTCGLSILTKMTSVYLYPIFVGVWIRNRIRQGATKASLFHVSMLFPLALPFLMFLPWGLFNRAHFGAWTPNFVAREYIRAFSEQKAANFGLTAIFRLAKDQFFNFLPTEWMRAPITPPPPEITTFLFGILFFYPALIYLVRVRKTLLPKDRAVAWTLGLSLPSMALLLNGIIYLTNMPLEGRFLYPTWIVWSQFVAMTYYRLNKVFFFLGLISILVSVGLLWSQALNPIVW